MRHVKSLLLLVPLAGALVPSVAFAEDDANFKAEDDANFKGEVRIPTPMGPIIIKGCGDGDC